MRNKTLWEKIETYPFFDIETGFDLTGEDGLLEYRKFLYLCAIYKRTQVPSQPVEHVLKAHQEKGAANFAELCRAVLGKTPNFGSLKTGRSAAKAHRQTRENYRKEFNKFPPMRYWPIDKRGIVEILGFGAIALGLGFLGLTWLLGPANPSSQILMHLGYGGVGLGMVVVALFTRAKHDGLTHDI